MVHITDLANGATATCTVEDRGPYAGGLIIDLAKDVFSRMAPLSTGVIQVSWVPVLEFSLLVALLLLRPQGLLGRRN